MVVASLVLTGIGAIVLTSVTDRRNTEAELREQTGALVGLFGEVTLADVEGGSETRGQRLERLSRTLSLEGIGVVVVPRGGTAAIGTLPEGIGMADIDLDEVRSGEIVSGRKGDLLWAAGGTRNPAGGSTLVVLTRTPDPIVQPAFRWFLVASIGTVLVALLVTIRLSRGLTSPIREASSTATRLAGGDLSARVDTAHTRAGGEVAELVTSVNSMADALERSRALERQFLLSVSHDLRTPLTNIRGYAEALTDGATADPAAVGEVIESESRRLERLVGDLLLLARLEGTGFGFDLASHDVVAVVEQALDGLRPEATERNVEVTLRAPAGESLRAVVDHDRFGQVVANLVGNALKFADHAVAVTLWDGDGRIHLAVGDDGPGISDADLPHVFERLYVARHNPKVAESGSGLGLAIARELVEGMGGSIVARRSALGGAELVVSLPPAPG